VPSGVWDASEYVKLPEYDGETFDQPVGAFMCHHKDGAVCAGWLGYGDPTRLLAARIGVMTGQLDPSVMDYKTDVPLFSSGAEAAAHGMRDIRHPSEDAEEAMRKIVVTRSVVGDGFPVYCNTCGGKDGRHSYHCHNDR
jgi:hypothetical protein